MATKIKQKYLGGNKGNFLSFDVNYEDRNDTAVFIPSEVPITETDPVFAASPAADITENDISNWNDASSASSDWNENNSDSKSYIENRTHYKGTSSSIYRTHPLAFNGGNAYDFTENPVTINGVNYQWMRNTNNAKFDYSKSIDGTSNIFNKTGSITLQVKLNQGSGSTYYYYLSYIKEDDVEFLRDSNIALECQFDDGDGNDVIWIGAIYYINSIKDIIVNSSLYLLNYEITNSQYTYNTINPAYITGTTVTRGTGDGSIILNVGSDDEYSDNQFPDAQISIASGCYSTASGWGTIAAGADSHAEGYMTRALDFGAHAEGVSTTASSDGAHAEGNGTIASNSSAHAEGTSTTASGYSSHAEGYNTTAWGADSHAEGYYTTAKGAYQHVFGKYNIIDSTASTSNQLGTYVEIVGKGTATGSRSNARTLDWSGNEVLAGKLTVGTGPTNNMDVATKQYVDTSLSTAIGNVNSFEVQRVNSLPTTNIDAHTIYFVPKTGETSDVHDEYMYINSAWELIGTTAIDLTGYATETYVNTAIGNISTDLAGLSDTTITTPTAGQILLYDSTTSKWVNSNFNAVSAETDTNVNNMLDSFSLDYTSNTLSPNLWVGGSY